MHYYTYIIFSSALNKFYIGYTSNSLTERIKKHNSNHKGFTGKSNDWILVWNKTFDSKSDAISLEKKIKKRGAKRFLQDINLLK